MSDGRVERGDPRDVIAAELTTAALVRQLLAHLQGRPVELEEALRDVRGTWESLRSSLEESSMPFDDPWSDLTPVTVPPGVEGRYEVLQPLGAGGMGSVFEAVQVGTRRKVALKVVHGAPRSLDDALRFFQQEVIAAARFSHPNIAQVYDAQVESGALWLAMELVSGGSLRDRLRSSDTLRMEESVEILRQILAGLSVAHEAGVIHRDLKPENVLLDVAPGGMTAKICDFGLAIVDERDALANETGVGAPAGTPVYMSPEHIEGRAVSPASDVYSMGVVAYELLAGAPPFHHAQHVMTLLHAHVNEAPPPLPEWVPQPLQAVVLQALAKAPADRFANARAMAEALAAACP